MPAAERAIRNDLVEYAHKLHARGWVANHDGNLTAKAERGRFVATPTSFSKEKVTLDTLLVVDSDGKRVSGYTRPFSEFALHQMVYAHRPDAVAVIHAHPPHASAMACAGVGMDRPFIAEAVVSLGPRIPLVPFAAPKTSEFQSVLEPFVDYYDAVLLENHGVLTWGDSVEQAFLRLELVEHLARIATLAQAWGGVKPLPDHVLRPLLDARKRAGLGPEARGAEYPKNPIAAASGDSGFDLVEMVTEEVMALLKPS